MISLEYLMGPPAADMAVQQIARERVLLSEKKEETVHRREVCFATHTVPRSGGFRVESVAGGFRWSNPVHLMRVFSNHALMNRVSQLHQFVRGGPCDNRTGVRAAIYPKTTSRT